MFLNTLSPSENSKKRRKRVGRGIGSTLGKTCGRGHKGQHARAGGYHKIGFEGGQMPLQRRLPKVGFKSKISKFSAEVRLSSLNDINVSIIDLQALKLAKIIPYITKKVKVIDFGQINKSIIVKGIKVSHGAASKIESAGGKIEV